MCFTGSCFIIGEPAQGESQELTQSVARVYVTDVKGSPESNAYAVFQMYHFLLKGSPDRIQISLVTSLCCCKSVSRQSKKLKCFPQIKWKRNIIFSMGNKTLDTNDTMCLVIREREKPALHTQPLWKHNNMKAIQLFTRVVLRPRHRTQHMGQPQEQMWKPKGPLWALLAFKD